MSQDNEGARDLPLAASRALRQAYAHPSVRAIGPLRQSDGWTLADVTIHTELPAAWRARGESPFGVRADEVVTVGLSPTFPLSSPWIVLRNDFPRHHPHIQPDKPGSPVRPCLVMGSPREVVQARGFIGLIEQLVEWLERAANLDLNDPGHGWEPVRRDTINDILVCDADRIRALAAPDGGHAFVTGAYIRYANADMYKLLLGRTPVLGEYAGSSLSRTDNDDGTANGSCLGLVAWATTAGSTSALANRYLPETVDTMDDLLVRAALYGCHDELVTGLTALRDGLTAAPAAHAFPLAIMLLARRPYSLVGSDSAIELCPYLIEIGLEQNFLDPATPVRLAAQRETITPQLLRRTSGDNPSAGTLDWTMLGCGSVGSKIALHAARAGRAPSIVVDRGNLNSHNYARHSALPYGEGDRLFLRAKADVVAVQIDKLGQCAMPVEADAIDLLRDEQGRAKLAPAGCAMIIDTTASIVTREALSHVDWPERPRIVEACLLGAGRIGYLAAEGPAANPSISDLAAEAYRLLALEPDAAALAFGAAAEEVVIGQGCSAATFPMPDADLSLLSAAMARPITGWARDGLPDHGEIRIGSTDEYGGLRWTISREAEWITVGSGPGLPDVRLHPRVHQAIEADVAAYPGVETGGVLVGRFSPIGNRFQIVDLIAAPADSTRSAAEFVLGRQGLKAAARRISQDTGGALQVVGTWHNHLAPSGPSTTDAVAGAILAIRQLVPALLLIHTPAGYSMLVAEAVLPGPAGAMRSQNEEPK